LTEKVRKKTTVSVRRIVISSICYIFGILSSSFSYSLALLASFWFFSVLLYLFNNAPQCYRVIRREWWRCIDTCIKLDFERWLEYRKHELVFVCFLRVKHLEILSSSRNCWKYIESQRVTYFTIAASRVNFGHIFNLNIYICKHMKYRICKTFYCKIHSIDR